MTTLGTPLSPSATRVLLLGSGELGKEVAIELQRFGVEVIAADRYADAPAMQVAHRSHVIDMLDAMALRALIAQEQPHLVVPEIEAIATDALAAIEAAGRTAVALPGDLMDADYRAALVDEAAKRLGGLDILVNNAGKQFISDDLTDLTDEQVHETFQINIMSMFTLSRAALKHMGPGSTIVNTTSVQAYNPNPRLLDYAATKGAINNFTKGLAEQLGPKGIRVNAVAPGPIWTVQHVSYGEPEEKLPEFGHSTPIGRAGQPVEMAPAYVFLASGESSYVNGETLNANGGTPTP